MELSYLDALNQQIQENTSKVGERGKIVEFLRSCGVTVPPLEMHSKERGREGEREG